MQHALLTEEDGMHSGGGHSYEYASHGSHGGGATSFVKRNALRLLVGAVLLALIIAVAVLAHDKQKDDDDSSSSSSNTPSGGSSSAADAALAAFAKRMKAMMDKSKDPCSADFYEYACGNMKIPSWADPDNYDFSFSTIQNETDVELLAIVRDKFPMLDPLFEGCLNTEEMDRLGLSAVQSYLDDVDAVTSLEVMMNALGKLRKDGHALNAFFGTTVEVELHNAGRYLFYVQPGGTSLQDYSDEDTNNELMSAIVAVFTNMSYSQDDAESIASDILNFEMFLANNTASPDSFEAMIELAEVTTPQDLSTETGFDLAPFLSGAGTSTAKMSSIGVVQKSFLSALIQHASMQGSELTFYKNYVKWHVMFGNLLRLSSPFRAIGMELMSWGITPPSLTDDELTVMGRFMRNNKRHRGGLPARFSMASALLDPQRRKQRMIVRARVARERGEVPVFDDFSQELCMQYTTSMFMDLLSHQWIDADFPQENLKAARVVVDTIYQQMGESLDNVEWLDSATRAKAKEKWSLIKKNVGYDDDWKDYLGLAMTEKPVADYSALAGYTVAEQLAQAGTTVNRAKFSPNTPIVINSFYNPQLNNINLLAGLMAEPFFSANWPDMLNLAAYGLVCGHELTHGFDNTGRFFDGTGAFVNWWTNASATQFDQRSQCLIDQFNDFEEYGIHVNGEQTLGENIADLGGIHLAYRAYRKHALPDKPLVEGFTNDQLFYLTFAQSWCAVESKETIENQVEQDPHSPAKFRVLGPLSNTREFAEAFGCSKKDFMGRSLTEDQCVLW